MSLYNNLRSAPAEALKTIGAGRLKGMSDINPQWRIQQMTAAFGPCGIGWKYEILKQWLETFGSEVRAFCNVNLYIKVDGEWSEPIPGTGGASFVTMERNGAYVSDECYKMALTDSLSVAMKALGMAADVYFAKGALLETKYAQQEYTAQSYTPWNNGTAAPNMEQIKKELASCTTTDQLLAVWNKYPQMQRNAEFTGIMTARKDQILKNNKS